MLGLLLLGVSDAMLGVAWPSMRSAFGAPLAGLGLVFAAITGGFLASSAGTALLLAQLRTGPRLVLAASATCVSIAGIALSPSWPALVVAAFVYGIGAGLLDPGLNTHLAIHHSNRELNVLHAGYGLGASIGPLVVGAALLSGLGWRAAYVPVLLLDALLLALFVLVRSVWQPLAAAGVGRRPGSGASGLVLGLVSFFAYTGIEVSAGGWSYTYLTLGRRLDPGTAALVVGSFWAALTVGRLIASWISTRVGALALLTGSVLLALAGALLLAAQPLAGLPLLGLGLAPVFPTLVSLTPAAQGEAATPAAVGYQMAAGSLGAALVPALVGVVLQRYGVALLPPLLVAGTVAQLGLAAGARLGPRLSNSSRPHST